MHGCRLGKDCSDKIVQANVHIGYHHCHEEPYGHRSRPLRIATLADRQLVNKSTPAFRPTQNVAATTTGSATVTPSLQ
jgi:hypothetical protein